MKFKCEVYGATLFFEFPIEETFKDLPSEQQKAICDVFERETAVLIGRITAYLSGAVRLELIGFILLSILLGKVDEASLIAIEYINKVKAGERPEDVFYNYFKDLDQKQIEIFANGPFGQFIKDLQLDDLYKPIDEE